MNFYLLSFIFSLLFGCEIFDKKTFKNLTEEQIENRIIVNKTNKNDIREKIGIDGIITFTADGKETWIYSYQEKPTNPIYFIPIVRILFGNYGYKRNLEIIFKHNIVESYKLSISNNKI